jgi:DNA-binding IclR family transcriptional regulator
MTSKRGAHVFKSDDLKTARTLEKGLAILSLFDHEHPRFTLSGISAATNIPMPTALRLARTLARSRYLHYDERTRSYELGSAVYRAASGLRSYSELIRLGHPHLVRLTEQTTESTALGVFQHGESLVIDMVLTPRPFKPTSMVGTSFPGLTSLYAKIAVAFGPDTMLEEALASEIPSITDQTITDRAVVRGEIELIRREGVAFGIETLVLGICTVAAPIFDAAGSVTASMAVVAPTERFGPVQMREHAAALRQETMLLSHEFGWRECQKANVPSLNR